jgi:rubrerythrin
MNTFTIDEIIEMAIQTERIGSQYYTSMAKQFKNDAGLAALFTTLAAKEQTHEKAFGELRGLVAKSGTESQDWEDVTKYLRAIVASEFFFGKGTALPAMDHIKTGKDAVKFAIGFEKETFLFYQELRRIVREQEIVDEILNEEKGHIMWLASFKATTL